MFDSNPRWLEIDVRPNSGFAFSILTSRQQVTASPYAIVAGKMIVWGGLASGTFCNDTFLYSPP